ncbi:MAG: GDCCVxC domain-containing (seleno)protein [Pseudomonadota bacterium]|nr:GDCCVxC domain-containing (seleno)protein [Pseudomonadota bacterium]
MLKPRPGDFCVYCSYATVPCPTIQAGNHYCA